MEGVSMEQSFCYNHVLQLYVKDTCLEELGNEGSCSPLLSSASVRAVAHLFRCLRTGITVFPFLVVVSTTWNHVYMYMCICMINGCLVCSLLLN